jgi:predicted Rossmann-fold nucleotide-binding protein
MGRKIGVYGSNVSEGTEVEALGRSVGHALAAHGCTVITGACGGTPYVVAEAAARAGAEVWGFTPELSREAHAVAYPDQDLAIYTRLIYVSEQYRHLFGDVSLSGERDHAARLKYRNLVSTIHADAGIVISGGWGTLNEFTNLIYDGKPIGVLTSSGGLAAELPEWFGRLRKKSASIVVFEREPPALVEAVLMALGG